MKILLTGATGFVGSSILSQIPPGWEAHGIGRRLSPALPASIPFHSLDLSDREKVTRLIKEISPQAILHCAALANIDYCEQHPQEADRINAEATATLLDACEAQQIKLVFCSTDTVFDGKGSMYREQDPPHAVNYYARTKITAEERIRRAPGRHTIARLALVMGYPAFGGGNAFLQDMESKLSKGEAMKFATNEIRTPIDVVTLGAALLELADSEFSGIIHLSGKTRINRYEMARTIARQMGWDPSLIHPVDSSSLPGRAPRPADVSLDNRLAQSFLKTPFLTLEEGLRHCLAAVGRQTP